MPLHHGARVFMTKSLQQDTLIEEYNLPLITPCVFFKWASNLLGTLGGLTLDATGHIPLPLHVARAALALLTPGVSRPVLSWLPSLPRLPHP